MNQIFTVRSVNIDAALEHRVDAPRLACVFEQRGAIHQGAQISRANQKKGG